MVALGALSAMHIRSGDFIRVNGEFCQVKETELHFSHVVVDTDKFSNVNYHSNELVTIYNQYR